eukprot:210803_1
MSFFGFRSPRVSGFLDSNYGAMSPQSSSDFSPVKLEVPSPNLDAQDSSNFLLPPPIDSKDVRDNDMEYSHFNMHSNFGDQSLNFSGLREKSRSFFRGANFGQHFMVSDDELLPDLYLGDIPPPPPPPLSRGCSGDFQSKQDVRQFVGSPRLDPFHRIGLLPTVKKPLNMNNSLVGSLNFNALSHNLAMCDIDAPESKMDCDSVFDTISSPVSLNSGDPPPLNAVEDLGFADPVLCEMESVGIPQLSDRELDPLLPDHRDTRGVFTPAPTAEFLPKFPRRRKQTSRACTNCVKAKAGCDRNRPCARCVRLQKPECINRNLNSHGDKLRSRRRKISAESAKVHVVPTTQSGRHPASQHQLSFSRPTTQHQAVSHQYASHPASHQTASHHVSHHQTASAPVAQWPMAPKRETVRSGSDSRSFVGSGNRPGPIIGNLRPVQTQSQSSLPTNAPATTTQRGSGNTSIKAESLPLPLNTSTSPDSVTAVRSMKVYEFSQVLSSKFASVFLSKWRSLLSTHGVSLSALQLSTLASFFVHNSESPSEAAIRKHALLQALTGVRTVPFGLSKIEVRSQRVVSNNAHSMRSLPVPGDHWNVGQLQVALSRGSAQLVSASVEMNERLLHILGRDADSIVSSVLSRFYTLLHQKDWSTAFDRLADVVTQKIHTFTDIIHFVHPSGDVVKCVTMFRTEARNLNDSSIHVCLMPLS